VIKNYVFTHTPTHGYLRVPVGDLRALDLVAEVGGDSFLDGDFVELACGDGLLFLERAERAGWAVAERCRRAELPPLPRYLPALVM
jgi:hypothetical protein